MTRVLLDSHVVLWVLDDSPRLGPDTRALLAQAVGFVSAASLWELQIKAGLGRLELPLEHPELLTDSRLTELPITWRHAARLAEADVLTHRDPFDRLLYVQAIVEDMLLVTADRHLLASPRAVRDARR